MCRTLTLQKSIDLTPLLPSAGPTGGEGEACPAPTISLTSCSFAGGLRVIMSENGSSVKIRGVARSLRQSGRVPKAKMQEALPSSTKGKSKRGMARATGAVGAFRRQK